MDFNKLSFKKIAILVMGGTLILSLIGLGLSADAFVNKKTTASTTKSALSENEKTYANMHFLKDENELKELLDAKASFLLYTGTQSCAWCRVSFDLDEGVVSQRASEFENGQPNGLFINASNSFKGTGNGPVNDRVLNDTYPFYALHDTTATSVSDYHLSGISRRISTVLLNTLSGEPNGENSIKLLQPVPFNSNGSEISIPGDFATTAASFTAMYNAYEDAETIKFKTGTQSLNEAKQSLVDRKTYGTPSFWAIVDGKVRFLISSYLTRAALKAYAKFFLVDHATIEDMYSALIS